MELIYLWSNEMGLLENQGVNFSSRYWVKVAETDENSRPTRLAIAKRNGLGGEFFNLEGKKDWPLLEVTGLVGQNGAGKTSVLRRIWQCVDSGINSFPEEHTIWIWGNGKREREEKLHVFIPEELRDTTEVEGEKGVNYIIAKGDPSKDIHDFDYQDGHFPFQIFFSPIFTADRPGALSYLRESEAKSSRGFNISTNALVRMDEARVKNLFDLYETEGIQKVLDLIYSGRLQGPLSFSPPTQLTLSFYSLKYGAIGELAEGNFTADGYIQVRNSLNKFNIIFQNVHSTKYRRGELSLEDYQIFMTSWWWIGYLRHLILEGKINRPKEMVQIFKKLFKEFEVPENENSEISSWLREVNGKIESVFGRNWENTWDSIIQKVILENNSQYIHWQARGEAKEFSKAINHAYEWFRFLLSEDSKDLLKDAYNKGLPQQRNWGLYLDISSDRIKDSTHGKQVQTLVEMVQKSQSEGVSFPIRFNWGPEILSAGEKYYLNLFARLNWIQRRLEKIEEEKPTGDNRKATSDRPVLILLDEPDTVMHPKWQQKLLHWLVQGLPAIFPDRKIQLILTSHSPFVCADLPKEHLVFLRRKEKRNDPHRKWTAEVVPPDGMANTFGANIHKIFTDTQFLGKNLLGEFANRKIKDLIGKVNNFKGKAKDYEHLRGQIDQIGEDFIRRKLIQQLDEKDESRLTQLEKEMKKLQDRMKKAEEEINQIKGKEGEDGQD